MENSVMERAKIVKEELVEQNMRFLAVYMETKNSCVIFLSEKEDKLGTLAVSVPRQGELPSLPISSILLGDRYAITARMFAEYVAGKKGKIALVSIYLEKMDEAEAQSILKKLLEKVVQAEAKVERENVGAFA
jgi:hypothetical protein